MKALNVAFLMIGIVLTAASASAQDKGGLEERVRKLEAKFAQLEERSLVEEVGAVTLTIPAGKTAAYATVKFKRPQPGKAVILSGETGLGGSFVITKTEAITRTQFTLVAMYFNGKPQPHAPYRTRIGYVVLRGEGEPEAEKPAAPASPPTPQQPPQPASPTWAQYRADCGKAAQELNEARTEQAFRQKYKGKHVRWSGTVVHVSEFALSSDYHVSVRMQPTDSIISDVSLDVPKELQNIALSLNEGDTVAFEGTLTSQGGTITTHMIDVVKLSKQ